MYLQFSNGKLIKATFSNLYISVISDTNFFSHCLNLHFRFKGCYFVFSSSMLSYCFPYSIVIRCSAGWWLLSCAKKKWSQHRYMWYFCGWHTWYHPNQCIIQRSSQLVSRLDLRNSFKTQNWCVWHSVL